MSSSEEENTGRRKSRRMSFPGLAARMSGIKRIHDEEDDPELLNRSPSPPAQPPPPIIEPPFPWATNRRATVHNLEYLVENNINRITGKVRCKNCDVNYDLELDLKKKFPKIRNFIVQNKFAMRERSPPVWTNPALPNCTYCHDKNCVEPVIPEDGDSINWLFLLLGQMLGCCTLEQLKGFCMYTEHHRAGGAKDRILYRTYLGVCKQLDPSDPFNETPAN